MKRLLDIRRLAVNGIGNYNINAELTARRAEGGNMVIVNGHEAEHLRELPQADQDSIAHNVLSELYRIWLREHGMHLESIEVSRKKKEDVGA